MDKPVIKSELAFEHFLSNIETAVGTEFEFKNLDSIEENCFLADEFYRLSTKDKSSKSEVLEKEITVKMTIRDLIHLSLEKVELSELRQTNERWAAAADQYFSETGDRQDKKLKKFANDVGLTDGKRHPKNNNSHIFFDYVCLFNGVNCEKTSKGVALKIIAKKYDLTLDAIHSILKSEHIKHPGLFPGVLPYKTS
jgi:hypothetical protein